jgi:hypothetical protein
VYIIREGFIKKKLIRKKLKTPRADKPAFNETSPVTNNATELKKPIKPL